MRTSYAPRLTTKGTILGEKACVKRGETRDHCARHQKKVAGSDKIRTSPSKRAQGARTKPEKTPETNLCGDLWSGAYVCLISGNG